ncbi:conjugal transfer protein TraM [Escherichia coli]|uniref:conjugal transfer protein TraM n=1 Tax=Escherichia coli TaxID=562 RepID=UPI00388DE3B9
MVLGRYLELVSDQYDEANRALTVSLQQQVEQSKETAGKVITDAANYVSEQVRQAVTAALADAGNDVRRQIANAQAASRDAVWPVAGMRRRRRPAHTWLRPGRVAALVAVAALVVVLLK